MPPPPGEVRGLIADLCEFCARDDLPAVAQAAVAHVQFETDPPVRRRGTGGSDERHPRGPAQPGLARAVLAPVSLVLAGASDRYVEGLTAFRKADAEAWLSFSA